MRNEMEYRYRECMNPSVLETGDNAEDGRVDKEMIFPSAFS